MRSSSWLPPVAKTYQGCRWRPDPIVRGNDLRTGCVASSTASVVAALATSSIFAGTCAACSRRAGWVGDEPPGSGSPGNEDGEHSSVGLSAPRRGAVTRLRILITGALA